MPGSKDTEHWFIEEMLTEPDTVLSFEDMTMEKNKYVLFFHGAYTAH